MFYFTGLGLACFWSECALLEVASFVESKLKQWVGGWLAGLRGIASRARWHRRMTKMKVWKDFKLHADYERIGMGPKREREKERKRCIYCYQLLEAQADIAIALWNGKRRFCYLECNGMGFDHFNFKKAFV